jgi:hypothetical protein
MDIALIAVGLAVYAWLLIIVRRQGVRKQLPWFACYVHWEVLAQCGYLATWMISHRLYVALYWWIEAVEIFLIVAAVRESFLRIFQGFTSKAGFRWSVWTVIAGAVIYAAWKAVYAPPLQSSRLDAFVVGAEFLFRWGILGIWALTTTFSFLLREPMDTREDAVVTGFSVASAAFVIYVGTFSVFGTKYTFITKYLPSVGYFLAAFWWIRVFSRPVQEFGFKELGMGPEDIARELRRYREFAEQILRKRW